MANEKDEVLLLGPLKPLIVNGLSAAFTVHTMAEAADKDSVIHSLAPRLRAIAVSGPPALVDPALMTKLPKLELVSSFGVGYDHIDAQWASTHGIIVTNTPNVLNEEVADTAIGLLLCTVRELPQSERFVRAGRWPAE